MDNMMIALEAWTIPVSKANKARCGGCQTARAYAIYTDNPPLYTPMNFSLLIAPMCPTYF